MPGDESCYDRPSSDSNEERKHFLNKNDGFVPLAVHEKQRKWFLRVIIIHWVVTSILLLIVVTVPMPLWKRKSYWIPNEIYSPLQGLVRYETRVFDSGFGNHTTKYMGKPTEENRRLWENLYQAGISKIPIEQAAQLPVKTTPIPEAPGYYVVGIDVFHQLHCLNQLRLRVWGVDNHHGSHSARDTSSVKEEGDGLQDIGHLDHCIDSIRQSLMCSSDISTIIWKWDEDSGSARPHANITHTCRDFDVIHQWALENRAPKWNKSIHVPDPLQE